MVPCRREDDIKSCDYQESHCGVIMLFLLKDYPKRKVWQKASNKKSARSSSSSSSSWHLTAFWKISVDWAHFYSSSSSPWLSTWATAWRCRHGARTAALCLRCRRTGHSVCPAGTGSRRASGCSSASDPVNQIQNVCSWHSNTKTPPAWHRGGMGCGLPPLGPAGLSTAGGLTSSCVGSMLQSWPWGQQNNHR